MADLEEASCRKVQIDIKEIHWYIHRFSKYSSIEADFIVYLYLKRSSCYDCVTRGESYNYILFFIIISAQASDISLL